LGVVWGSGFWVQGLGGVWVQGTFRGPEQLVLRVQDLRILVLGFRVQGSGFWAQDSRLMVQGAWFWVQGLEFRVNQEWLGSNLVAH